MTQSWNKPRTRRDSNPRPHDQAFTIVLQTLPELFSFFYVELSNSTSLMCIIKPLLTVHDLSDIKNEKILPRIEPSGAGWEAQILLLCSAALAQVN
jgi:hypothetical protein